MHAQFIPLLCVLVSGSLAAAVGAIFMSHRLVVQTARSRQPPGGQTPPL